MLSGLRSCLSMVPDRRMGEMCVVTVQRVRRSEGIVPLSCSPLDAPGTRQRSRIGAPSGWPMKAAFLLPLASMPSHISRLIVTLLLSLLLLPACAGSQHGAIGGQDLSLVRSSDGFIHLAGPRVSTGLWELVPTEWPEVDVDRPIVGVARSDGNGRLLPIAVRDGADFDNLQARRVEALRALPGSKRLVTAEATGDEEVTLQAGSRMGVALHDVYFLIDDPHRMDPAAILEVNSVDDDESSARILHARRPLSDESSMIALFMELRRDAPQRPATAAFAGLAGHTELQSQVSTLLQEYLETFSISNLGLLFPDVSPSPTRRNAERLALEEIELEGTGFLVFSDLASDPPHVNVAGFGDDRRAHLVGILPGGLPLPSTSDDPTALANELVALALPALLAIREEHALALYVTWWLLDQPLSDAVRYHLREHLALRLDTLGRTHEGIVLMEEDVQDGSDLGDAWIERNAVSIRAFLYHQSGDADLELADARRFLELTQASDPEADTYRERLHVAIAERATGNAESSLRSLEQMQAELHAQGENLADVRYANTLHFSIGLALGERPADALLVLSSLDPDLEQLTNEERVQVDLMRLELLLHLEDSRSARQSIEGVLGRIGAVESRTSQANFLERIAWVLIALDDRGTALRLMVQSLELALQDHNYRLVAETLQRLGNLQLDTATRIPPDAAIHLLRESRQSFHLGSELLLQLGSTADAAGLLVVLAAMEHSARNPRQAHQHLERAEAMALASVDAHLMLEILTLRSRMAQETGDEAALDTLQERVRRWSGLAGVEAVDLVGVERRTL